MKDNILPLLTVCIIAVIFAFVFFLHSLGKQERIEKDCGEEHMTLTSETFKCPEGKPFVHLSVFGKSARAYCCAKD